MAQRVYDVTVPLSPSVPAWPGEPRFEAQRFQRIEDGHPANVTRIAASVHSGTHVDAPRHFLADGATVDQLPLEILMGKARVLDLKVLDRIRRKDLEEADLRDDIRVLIKTRMSGQMRNPEFQPGFVALAEDAATYLVQVGIKLVGIDYLSIEPFDATGHPAHHALLGAGVVVVEGLDLSEVPAGEYEMACLPLRIEGAEGAPARVVLRTRP
jgi:arylformamidase